MTSVDTTTPSSSVDGKLPWTPELCQIFDWPACKDPRHNDRRLWLRRHLESLTDKAWAGLKNDFSWKSSLTHPHVHNKFQVHSLRVHLGRLPQETAKLVDALGQEFKESLVSPGRSLHVESRLDAQGLSCGLMLPAEAWWDFQPLLDEGVAGGGRLLDALQQQLPDFVLETPAWISPEPLGRLDVAQWKCVLKSLKPGEHPVTLRKRHGFQDNPAAFLERWAQPLKTTFKALQWTNPLPASAT